MFVIINQAINYHQKDFGHKFFTGNISNYFLQKQIVTQKSANSMLYPLFVPIYQSVLHDVIEMQDLQFSGCTVNAVRIAF